jgi:hypothetical protein
MHGQARVLKMDEDGLNVRKLPPCRLRLVAIFLVLSLAGCNLWCGCSERSERASRDVAAILANLEEASCEQIASVCAEYPEFAEKAFKDALADTEFVRERYKLLCGLVEYDLDGNLRFVLEAAGDSSTLHYLLGDVLRKRLQPEHKLLLQKELERASGDCAAAVASVLSVSEPDRESLNLAKRLLRERTPNDLEAAALLGLLGNASLRLADSSGLELVREYLESPSGEVRMAALFTCAVLPGDEAEQVLSETLDKWIELQPELGPEFRENMFRRRANLLREAGLRRQREGG